LLVWKRSNSADLFVGTIAAVAATPFDLARTLKQSDEMNKRPRKSMLQSFRSAVNEVLCSLLHFVLLISQRGFFSLWSGSSVIIMRQALFTSAQLSSYDMVKKSLSWYHNELNKEIFASIFSGVDCSELSVILIAKAFSRLWLSLHWSWWKHTCKSQRALACFLS
jgi:hypothetical protein